MVPVVDCTNHSDGDPDGRILEPPVGFEPTTYRLQGDCSGQLS